MYNDLSKEELQHRIAYAERQFEIYKMRALMNHAKGNLERMRGFIQLMTHQNDELDKMRRQE